MCFFLALCRSRFFREEADDLGVFSSFLFHQLFDVNSGPCVYISFGQHSFIDPEFVKEFQVAFLSYFAHLVVVSRTPCFLQAAFVVGDGEYIGTVAGDGNVSYGVRAGFFPGLECGVKFLFFRISQQFLSNTVNGIQSCTLRGEKSRVAVTDSIGIAHKSKVVHIVLQWIAGLAIGLFGELGNLPELALGPVVYHENIEVVSGGNYRICF